MFKTRNKDTKNPVSSSVSFHNVLIKVPLNVHFKLWLFFTCHTHQVYIYLHDLVTLTHVVYQTGAVRVGNTAVLSFDLCDVSEEKRVWDALTAAHGLHPQLLCVSLQWWERTSWRSSELSVTLPAMHLDSSIKPACGSTSPGRPSTSPIIPAFASSP